MHTQSHTHTNNHTSLPQIALNDVEVSIENIVKLTKELQVHTYINLSCQMPIAHVFMTEHPKPEFSCVPLFPVCAGGVFQAHWSGWRGCKGKTECKDDVCALLTLCEFDWLKVM